MNMREMVKELEQRRERVREMGGEKRVARQKERGKMTARERLDYLFDDGEFLEVGMHGTVMGTGEEQHVPADGVVTALGKIRGRMTAVAAYDFTVKGGSIGRTGEVKVARMREIALVERIPIIWLVDSAGARIDAMGASGGMSGDMISLFAASGALFQEQVIMSGVVPQVAAMVGPGAAGTAYIPGLADFVPMVRGTSSMALAGPPLVKAAMGEEVDEETLGGAKVHTRESGNADLMVKGDRECLDAIREYLSYFPQNCEEKPEIMPCDDPVDRGEDSLLDLIPENPKAAYDMYEVVHALVDHGRIFDLKPRWGRSIITCFARMGGYSVGIVANNPKQLGGTLGVDSADKAAKFVNLCDSFNIPLIFLQDVPGFMVGSRVEKAGIIRHGAKMLHAVASATVPKLTVVCRKGYGAGYYVMNGRAYNPDLLFAWPGAEISVMGPEGMVGIAGRALKGQEMPEETKQELIAALRKNIDIYKVAGWGYVDDVISPTETRRKLIQGLELTRNKHVERPWRKAGVRPV
ncbi:MAG TPA: acyl-CoA carboxylase subunit beta [Gammaproteobacteria bacterium]|nr:acyl-CoA carboxylase subunit beta [Gammaproteobacteria bacterium]